MECRSQRDFNVKGIQSFKGVGSLPGFGGSQPMSIDQKRKPLLMYTIILILVALALALVIPRLLGSLADDPSTIQEYYTVTKACSERLTQAIISSNQTADSCAYSASQVQRLRDGDRMFFLTAIASGVVLNAFISYLLYKKLKGAS